MERIELTVQGEQASTIPSAYQDIPQENREDYAGNDVVVVVTERHYRFSLVEVQATTIMELTDETTCKVTIIVGAGGYGLDKARDFGRESEEGRKLRRKIETYCEDADLAIERQ